eukprot:m.79492 g.79492  ORF g.79492 m.79492 type:complete len:99 (-) comp14628_c0_seq3:550-846(-)
MSENDATGVSAQEELFSDGSDLPPALQFTTTHDDITIEGAVVGVPKHSAHGGFCFFGSEAITSGCLYFRLHRLTGRNHFHVGVYEVCVCLVVSGWKLK